MEGNKKRVKSRGWLMLASVILIFVAIVIFLIAALNGKTVVTGEFDGNKVTETLVCESERVNYPFFKYDNSNSKSLKINAIFEDEKIGSISLFYKLNYSNEEMAKKSESVNHAAMSESFASDGMKFDDLNSKYSFLDNSLQMSLYAKNSELNEKSLRYFMLYNIYEVGNLTKEEMAKIYNNAGLDCEIIYNKTKEEVNEK